MRTNANKSDKEADFFAGFIRKRRERVKSRIKEAKQRMAVVEALWPLFDKYHLSRVFVFGSVSRGSSGVSSDIDLYIEEVSGEDYWKLRHELEEAAGKLIDLYCQLDDPVFVKKVKERGKLVYTRWT